MFERWRERLRWKPGTPVQGTTSTTPLHEAAKTACDLIGFFPGEEDEPRGSAVVARIHPLVGGTVEYAIAIVRGVGPSEDLEEAVNKIREKWGTG